MLTRKLNIFQILLLFPIVIFSQKASNDTLNIDSSSLSKEIGKYFSYYEDEEHEYNIRYARNIPFKKSEDNILNFGFKNYPIWLKLNIKNDSDKDIKKIVRIKKSLQDSIILYTKNEVFESGFMVKESDKIIKGSSIYFPIKLKKNEFQTLYFKVSSKYGISFNVDIINTESKANVELQEIITISLLIGALLIIAIYNLFLAFGLKDSLYVWYSVGVILSLFTQLLVRGFAKLFIINDEHFFLHQWLPVIIIGSGVIVLANFCIKFLNTKSYSKLAYNLLKFLIFYQIISIAYQIISYYIFGIKTTNITVAVGALLFGFIALSSGIITYLKGNKYAIYFIAAWSLYSITIVLYVFTLLNIIPINAVTANAYMLGSVLECLLLSFALAHRYNLLQSEKLKLESDNLSKNESIIAKQKEIVKLMNESINHLKDKAKLTETLQSISKEEKVENLEKLLKEIKLGSADDSKNLVIKQSLVKLNENFKNKLVTHYSNLTKTELEIAILIKSGLSRSEISNLRNTSIDAVKMSRRRLKSKFNLKKEDSLDDFISKL